MKQRILVFIESNTTGTGKLLGDRCVARGIKPIYLVNDPEKYPFLGRDFDYAKADTRSVIEMQSAITEFVESGVELTGISTSSDYYVSAAAELAKLFNMPGPSSACVQFCRDKYMLRAKLDERSMGSVAYRLVRSQSEAVKAFEEMKTPVVVKPRRGSGSVAVLMCSEVEDVEKAYAINERYCAESTDCLEDIGLLVEEYCGGDEYSVEVFDGAVVGITKKYLSGPPVFVEMGHDYPAKLDKCMSDKVVEYITGLVSVFGLTWGALHVEIKIDGENIHLIEINPRLAGGMIPRMIALASGLDLLEAQLSRVTGQIVMLEPTKNAYSAIRFLVAAKSGVAVRRVCNGEWDDSSEIQIYFDERRELTLNGDYRDRIGHVIATANDREALLTSADHALMKAKECIEIETA